MACVGGGGLGGFGALGGAFGCIRAKRLRDVRGSTSERRTTETPAQGSVEVMDPTYSIEYSTYGAA